MVSVIIKSNKAFSIMGVLVAAAIGLIVITGLTKLFVHMNTQITQLEKKAQQANLIGLIGNYMKNPDHCKQTLSPGHVVTAINACTSPISIYSIQSSGGGSIIDLAQTDQLRTQYGIEGYTTLELICTPSSSSPCSAPTATQLTNCTEWKLSLISQTYINDVPSFNRLMEIPITLNRTSATNFDCN